MKTLSDYHKKVLGISLNGRSKEGARQKTEQPEPVGAGPFCFLCHKEDFEKNKDLVLKILKAAGVDQSVVFFDDLPTKAFKEVFTFSYDQAKALNFQSFSVISRSPDLKKNLWAELKKRMTL